MAKEGRLVEPSVERAIRLSQRLIFRRALTPPIDVERLVRDYADLEFRSIPFFGIDGVSIGLKVPGVRPTVVVNQDAPATRRRFTLAHELGHILIPWHTGTIVDHMALIDGGTDEYRALENEANAFASGLLIPSIWLSEKIEEEPNLAHLHLGVIETCHVSPLAAAIRVSELLPKNIVYCCEDGLVEFSGRTDGTLADTLAWGTLFEVDAYSYASTHYTTQHRSKTLHWWVLPDRIAAVNSSDGSSWRELLEVMLETVVPPEVDRQWFRQSINGVFARANSLAQRAGDYGVEQVVAAAIQRFNGREQFSMLLKHANFMAFISLRAQELVSRAVS